MELKDIKSVYFIGAGGIGMSAIARYFLHRNDINIFWCLGIQGKT